LPSIFIWRNLKGPLDFIKTMATYDKGQIYDWVVIVGIDIFETIAPALNES